MRLAHAVVGFVDDAVAKELQSGQRTEGPVEIRVEAGNRAVLMRIPQSVVAEFRFGSSRKGETGVQVILKGRPQIEIVTTTAARAQNTGLTAFEDPTIKRLLTRAAAFQIYLA